MMRSIYLKTLYDKRFFMLGWGVGLAVLGALMTSFYPAMHQGGAIDALVANLPPAFKGLVGNLADLNSFDTYLASQLFDIRVPLIVGIMAIILGLSLSIADEEKGELRTILSLPISRTKLLIHKWLAMVTILLLIVLGLGVGIYAVLPLVDGAVIQLQQVGRLLAVTALLAVTFGTIPFGIGLASGKRAVATAVSIFTIIGSFILSTFGQAVDWLSDFEKLSLLHYFPAVDIVKGSIEVGDMLVLAVVTVLLLAVAFGRFRRRDIG